MDIIQPNSIIKININKIDYELNGLIGFNNIKECLSTSLINTKNKIKCYKNYYKMIGYKFYKNYYEMIGYKLDYLDNKIIYYNRVVNNTLNLDYYSQLEHEEVLTVNKLIIANSDNFEKYEIFNNDTLLMTYDFIIYDYYLNKYPYPYKYKIIHDDNSKHYVLLIDAKEVLIILDDIDKLKEEKIQIINRKKKALTDIRKYENTKRVDIIKGLTYKDYFFRVPNQNCIVGINGQITEYFGHDNCTLINLLPIINQKYNRIQSNCDTHKITDPRNICLLDRKNSIYNSLNRLLKLVENIYSLKNIPKIKDDTGIIPFIKECEILKEIDNSILCNKNYLKTKNNCIIYNNEKRQIC